MENQEERVQQTNRVVLIGGGHAHVVALRRLAAQGHLSEMQVTVLNDRAEAYYSGMLPGVLAGRYRAEQAALPIEPFCAWLGVAYVSGRAIRIDAAAHRVHYEPTDARGQALSSDSCLSWLDYDVASLDVGSSTDGFGVPGMSEVAVPTRPVARLIEVVDEWAVRDLAERIVVVGAGAAGVELAMALRARLPHSSVTLADAHSRVLSTACARLSRVATAHLERRSIEVVLEARVVAVEPHEAVLDDGRRLPLDHLVWAGGPAAHPLASYSGLPTDARGFVRVDEFLRVLDCPDLFAAGDCCSLEGFPWVPKAGVYAVREGPVLADNLVALLSARPGDMHPYTPQQGFLSLLATGDGEAIGLWKGFVVSGPWTWYLKDHIDRRFMRLHSPPSPSNPH